MAEASWHQPHLAPNPSSFICCSLVRERCGWEGTQEIPQPIHPLCRMNELLQPGSKAWIISQHMHCSTATSEKNEFYTPDVFCLPLTHAVILLASSWHRQPSHHGAEYGYFFSRFTIPYPHLVPLLP